MKDYFSINMSGEELQNVSVLGLAHIGDAVFELLVRSFLCANGKSTAKGLHQMTVSFVRAPAQAKAMERLLPELSEAERLVYKRGRNAKVNSVPKNAAISDYHSATGLEALFGYLYLEGDTDRINTLFSLVMED